MPTGPKRMCSHNMPMRWPYLPALRKASRPKPSASKLLTDTSLVQASIYFKYYVHQALVKTGMGNDYMNWLGIWRENIKMGMTTWAEMSDISASRSDCHAWGSSPNIELFRTVLGIESNAPGFKNVKIEPHLGAINPYWRFDASSSGNGNCAV